MNAQASVSQKTDSISPLLAAYDQAITRGELHADEAQQRVVEKLDQLREVLLAPPSALSGLLNRLFDWQDKETDKSGLYIWGDVGRGKSMLMDLFYNHVQGIAKKRVHFHAFMQNVHARIHDLRQAHAGDPVAQLARELLSESKLLCFDELQANDVADATLLYRLFSLLFDAGMVIVSTSNHPPETLYTGGIQAERFDKFIALIHSHTEVVSLASDRDYRTGRTAHAEKRYVYPLGADSKRFVDGLIASLGAPTHAVLNVHGRKLDFEVYAGDSVRFTFAQLCETAMGAADYLALATRARTLILENIPALAPEKRNEAKRFVTLIDALYEHKVKLVVTAEVPPEQIYASGDGSFEFSRTVSRLLEMQSNTWPSHDA